ncbi:hypothetical protein GLOIN_2v1671856 [Rhizophagus clarus]|uniref:F-box domain-containing protein n=1 Tax=Rhizophagus clarus TaxID=94130 RepID=A0A8H3LVV6_9GLOM|nr:hypothetical protein GLOIN_2v1671856 [Rhizophagus clarus]
MLNPNKDVLSLITENLEDDKISLHSCLLVNRSWCEVAVPILWKIPGRIILSSKKAEDRLFNVIVLHLSKESRVILKEQGVTFAETYQQPLFNYINFWRHLNLRLLEEMLSRNLGNSSSLTVSMIKLDLLSLFINKNTKFISLYIPENSNWEINNISWAEQCFSDLKNLCCDDIMNQNILKELTKISESIKKLICDISKNSKNISGIVRLIEAQKNLNEVNIFCNDGEIVKIIEELLIKKAITIQYLRLSWEPAAKFFSHFLNLKILEIDTPFFFRRPINYANSNQEKSLPTLKILKGNLSSYMILMRLIKSANVHLTTISIRYCSTFYGDNEVRELIQTIYQNCPNLRYIKVPFKRSNLIDFEKLLVNSKYLDGLVIDTVKLDINCRDLFKILLRSSSLNLFKIKFTFDRIKFKLLKSFLVNWKGRQPMLLQINFVNFIDTPQESNKKRLMSLIEEYKKKGIVKKFDLNQHEIFEEFEWVHDESQLHYWTF